MRSDSRLGLVVSTTDLLKYLACEELTALDLLRVRGEVVADPVAGASLLAAKKGLVSEADVLDILEQRYDRATRISSRDSAAFEETVDAMKAGAGLIYQGLLIIEAEGLTYESRP